MASDGRYNFRNCIPEGRITIASAEPGQIIRRNWSFVVNTPPQAVNELDNGDPTDTRKIVRGYDGLLLDGNGQVLATVNTWSAELNFTNVRYQPPGQRHEVAIPMGFDCTLSFTEAVLRDADLLKQVLDAIQPTGNDTTSVDVELHFQGLIRTRG